MGEYFLKSLQELQRDEPIMTAVRGRGLFIAFDLPDPKTRDEFWKGLFDRGAARSEIGRARDSFPSRARYHDGSRRRSDGSAARSNASRCALNNVPIVRMRPRCRDFGLYLCNQFSINSASPTKIPASFAANGCGGGPVIEKFSPIDGKLLASVRTATDDDYETAITRAQEAFVKWRITPGPVRGETVRRSATRCANSKPNSASSSRSRPARSSPRAKAKCRR